MLPVAARLTHRDDFTTVIRTGRRFGRTMVVVHVLLPSADRPENDSTGPDPGARRTRVGFVVSKAVGGAVVRHQVTRRLRHLMRARLTVPPPGTLLVVRALPASADADSNRLAAELDGALRSALHTSRRRCVRR